MITQRILPHNEKKEKPDPKNPIDFHASRFHQPAFGVGFEQVSRYIVLIPDRQEVLP